VTVSAALPTSVKVGAVPTCTQTWAVTGPADRPGRFGVIAVAGVGKGTVSVVLVRAVARACASSVVPRMKFTTGRPTPISVNPLPVIVKLAGGLARSTELGVMALTLRVSVTVSATLVTRVKELLPTCCQTWAVTEPADSQGRFGVIAVAGVGKGTVSVVLVRAVARACPSSVVPRMKFTTGRPKPRFANPPPVIVKLAGGLARSTELGLSRVSLTVSVVLPISVNELLPACCQT